MNEDKIKRMLSEDRMARMAGDRLLADLALTGNETVVDAGAGPGAFTFRFARMLSAGRVYAVDVDTKLLKMIEDRAKTEGVENIVTVQADILDIPIESADLVFCCTVLHEVAEKERFLADYYDKLKPGGKMVIVEFSSGRRRLDETNAPMRTFIAAERTQALMATCGFRHIETQTVNPLIYMTLGQKL